MVANRETNNIEIPDYVPMVGWKEVGIEECHQSLIDLDKLVHRMQVVSEYYRRGIPNSMHRMYLRQEAAERLIEAANLLPSGYNLIIFDSYRPLTVQESLFNTFKDQLQQQYPQKSEEEIIEYTQTYVSLPSKDPTKPSPHATGGAVDLSIIDPMGFLLNMGTDFDSFEIMAQTAYFKNIRTGEYIH